MTVEIHGPFLPEHRVTIDGYKVPYVTATPLDDGTINIVVDRRFGMERSVSREEFERWMPILANAMAVAAGYSCHGENCTPINPFMTRMSRLSWQPRVATVDGERTEE